MAIGPEKVSSKCDRYGQPNIESNHHPTLNILPAKEIGTHIMGRAEKVDAAENFEKNGIVQCWCNVQVG
jgi:hypothetical protein